MARKSKQKRTDKKSNPRVVSLIASSTEIIHALGFGHLMVGRSHECDYPESVRALPQVTAPKFKTDGTSYAIDQQIRKIVQEGLSVYRVDADKLNELKPDIIITQTQCEVCAVSEKDAKEATCELVDSNPEIVSLHPNRLGDVWADIRRVAEALGEPERADELIYGLRKRVMTLYMKMATLGKSPKVGYLEWIDPIFVGGNWMPELVEMAGGQNLFGKVGEHSPVMKWEEVLAANPDVLVVCPCGYDLKRTREEMRHLAAKPEWSKLKAVQDGRVYLADGNQFFNRPGPRLVESLEILAEMFHPAVFDFGHKGKAWESFS